MAQERAFKYKWAKWGDLNAFFGLMLDNVVNLVILTGILISPPFNFPKEIILEKMIPGTALGVLIGDLLYTFMAFRLAKRTGRQDVTAMPLGLDTPSTIGIALAVLGPMYMQTSKTMNPHDAAILTWHVGMATLIFIGLVKVFFSFFGDWIRRTVPQAGLLGSIGGIGLALLAFFPLLDIFEMPIVGIIALGLVLYALVARIRLPFNIPGMLAAIVVGSALYYVLGASNLLASFKAPVLSVTPAFPLPVIPSGQAWSLALQYLPVAIPFGLLTIVGGINVTESARVAGDNYRTRDILLVEAGATLAAGFFGGVAQSTPYIGHPAYKKMGGRAAYTLATGLFIGIFGILGLLQSVLQILPKAVVVPILIFVGFEIVKQSFLDTPRKHAPAVVFAYLPIIAYLLLIWSKDIFGAHFNVLSPRETGRLELLTALANGFILTAMIWGAAAAHIIDRSLRRASIYFLIAAALTFFGLIHSIKLFGDFYLPWELKDPQIPYRFAIAYGALASMLAVLSFTRGAKERKG